MRGIIEFTEDILVCKCSEYTKEEFLEEARQEYDWIEVIEIYKAEWINKGLCRFYPKGNSELGPEFEDGEPVYGFVDRKKNGVFEVWTLEY